MMHQETDRELLTRYARDGTQQAFEEVVRRHLPMVYGAARRWAGDAHRAEEVAQGVFLLLSRKAGDRGWGDDVGGWLYRAVGYAGRNARREDGRRRKRETEGARMKSQMTVREAEWEDLGPVVDEAISALSRRDAEVIRLRHLQGLDGAAVARCLGVSEPAARKRVERALDRLRDVLARRGVVASAMSIGGMLDAHGAERVSAELVGRVIGSLRSGGSIGAGSVAGAVKGGLVMAKVKAAAVVCAAVMAVGAAAVAVNKEGEKRGAAAVTTRPAFRADAKAGAVLHRVADFYVAAKTLSADFSCSSTTEARGRKGESSSASTLRLQRPNKMAVVSQKSSSASFTPTTVVSDGRELYEYVPFMRSYAVTPAPATLDEVIEPVNVANLTMGGSETWGLLWAFASSRPFEKMTAEVALARYVGTGEVGGVRADQIELVWAGDSGTVCQLWVAAGDKPFVLRVTSATTTKVAVGPRTEDVKGTSTCDFSNWKADEALPADAFAFAPAAGAKRVETFAKKSSAPDGKHALIGKAAPAFELDLLDGGKADLASHGGKEVVMLDFWATWCGPCVEALPQVAEVAKAYKAKGVAFYAVDQEGDAKTVGDFLKEHQLEVPVALDRDGKVGDSYKAEGIPQTVIIDRQGVVRVVHVGLVPDLREKLSAELDKVLAGEQPVRSAGNTSTGN